MELASQRRTVPPRHQCDCDHRTERSSGTRIRVPARSTRIHRRDCADRVRLLSTPCAVHTSRLVGSQHRARSSVQRFFRKPVQIVSANREALLDAHEVNQQIPRGLRFAARFVGLHTRADVLLTADTDFDKLCADESFAYRNPIPSEIHAEFGSGLAG